MTLYDLNDCILDFTLYDTWYKCFKMCIKHIDTWVKTDLTVEWESQTGKIQMQIIP